MNLIKKIFILTPLLVTFLKGHQLFISRDFNGAILKFEKCLSSPNFHHDLLFSLHGQALAAVGRLQEAHPYLLKACENYEKDGWQFKDESISKTAENCINALKHTCHHLGTNEGSQYFSNWLIKKRNNHTTICCKGPAASWVILNQYLRLKARNNFKVFR
ncbi:hypothetical protein JWJ90_21690 [Desulfobulbus rhabdoformis]|uniref:hypothetical protein n=1 Tax=Desulfobulbus rhabdoformis TaxID=34032 RepID=UPI001963A982|nr:hypothetical protein [Desulfobulbus rhabdoformis]MBM9616879.1 hypothetical protein [Desulfobulbus rhabdoformis]